ncbi:uncharacterized protein LOC128998860 [Macrosteles quadrilineatus]|uniref:uncharacterized protein LOC128998860 n=1 Tax=Macrosteles quadrilineatus TaxID=74068 RepID=UPI0023E22BE8|nr:uncharacterized protein LOC128998860 [Macrosteles quadrilineatus]
MLKYKNCTTTEEIEKELEKDMETLMNLLNHTTTPAPDVINIFLNRTLNETGNIANRTMTESPSHAWTNVTLFALSVLGLLFILGCYAIFGRHHRAIYNIPGAAVQYREQPPLLPIPESPKEEDEVNDCGEVENFHLPGISSSQTRDKYKSIPSWKFPKKAEDAESNSESQTDPLEHLEFTDSQLDFTEAMTMEELKQFKQELDIDNNYFALMSQLTFTFTWHVQSQVDT